MASNLSHMNRLFTKFALVLAATVVSSAALADRQFTDEQWTLEISNYVEKLKTVHLNPFHAVSQEDFEAAVQKLTASLPALTDEQIALEFSRLAALIGDGHTWVFPSDAVAAQRVPVDVFEFHEGLYIVRAASPYESLAGLRVVAIGDKPVSGLLAAAEAYTSRDNEWSLLERRSRMLSNRTFLENQGAAVGLQQIAWTLQDSEGRARVVEFPIIPRTEFIAWLNEPVAVPKDAPLYRQRPEVPYWVEYLPDARAVYMRFSAVDNRPGGPHLAQFSEDLMNLIDEKRAEKLIIDARDNGGGNGALLTPLIRRISENKRINRPGRLFLITNRATFSAALMLTVRMERQTEVIFAGEPGGGRPNSYSERTDFALPITGMTGSISSIFHEEGEPGDTRAFVPVDIPMSPTAADYFANRDPVLDAILEYKKPR